MSTVCAGIRPGRVLGAGGGASAQGGKRAEPKCAVGPRETAMQCIGETRAGIFQVVGNPHAHGTVTWQGMKPTQGSCGALTRLMIDWQDCGYGATDRQLSRTCIEYRRCVGWVGCRPALRPRRGAAGTRGGVRACGGRV